MQVGKCLHKICDSVENKFANPPRWHVLWDKMSYTVTYFVQTKKALKTLMIQPANEDLKQALQTLDT